MIGLSAVDPMRPVSFENSCRSTWSYASCGEQARLVSMKLSLKIFGLGFGCTRVRAVFDEPKVLKNVRPLFSVSSRTLTERVGQKARHTIGAIAAHATKDKFFCI